MLAAIDWSQLWNSNLELFAVITGVICVGLITFENRSRSLAWWNWPIGILTSAAYVYIFWQYKLYFNSVLQMFYVVSGFYGAWKWKYGGEDRTELPIRRMGTEKGILWGTLALFGALLLSVSFGELGVQSAAPFWDALVVMLSLTAQFIMTQKYKVHWLFWIAVDIVGVFLFASQGLEMTAILYVIYGSLCCRGIFTWRNAYTNEQASLAPAA